MKIITAYAGSNKLEVRIEDTKKNEKKILAIRLDGQEVLAFQIYASIGKLGAHDYSDGCDVPELKIEEV